ncbi:MAG: VapD family protein [Eubacterium sp.]|nr:VapD family protein [Eubacterium sp.]
MEKKYFKALNFDLDTKQLKEHYPGANYRQAYDDLRRCFKQHRFSHRQGSGYISDDKLTTADIYDLMDELSRYFPWLGVCVNKIDVTNVGRQHDLTELLKPAEDIVIDTSLLIAPAGSQQETE